MGSLAAKVLLEQSQEAAMAGQRMVLAASHAHTTVLGDAKHREHALVTARQMDELAAKDEVQGASNCRMLNDML